MPMKVAVIGAGAFGLCTLRHLASDPDKFEPVGFEKQLEAGGLWVYSDTTTVDEHGLPDHHAVYKDLRVNLSKEIIGFTDYPLPDGTPTYPHHTVMKQYLQSYTKDFDLLKYIKFQTLVTKVQPVKTDGHVTWKVTTRDLVTNSETTSDFDAVMVANGHEFTPSVPDIPGKAVFQGEIAHSRSYRDGESCRDKTVMIVGMSFSGHDLLYLLAPIAKKIYVSHNQALPLSSTMPSNAEQKPGIREIVQDGVISKNGEHIKCDVIMFCTGYQYAFPFLQEGINISTNGGRVTPLYKHMFHIELPTLCFIGLAKRALLYKLAEAQAIYACAVLRGDIKLPTAEEMRADEQREFKERILDQKAHPKLFHDFAGPEMWAYFDFLLKAPNQPKITEVVRKLWNLHLFLWSNRFHMFRSLSYCTRANDEYGIIEPTQK